LRFGCFFSDISVKLGVASYKLCFAAGAPQIPVHRKTIKSGAPFPFYQPRPFLFGWGWFFVFKAAPHNSRLTPCAPSRRPLYTAGFEKMLVDTQSSNCAFLFAIGAH
jgi:hypothetical protein